MAPAFSFDLPGAVAPQCNYARNANEFFPEVFRLSPKAAEQPAPLNSQGGQSPSSDNTFDAANEAAREASAECLDRHWQSGGQAPDFATPLGGMPLSPVTLIPVVLITAAELDYVRAGGRAAREDLVQRLQSAGVGHRSDLLRASVV